MYNDFAAKGGSLLRQQLLKTEELFIKNIHLWSADFAAHFQLMCSEIVRLQTEAGLSAISHMEYTMLYTNFINRRYTTEVWVYGSSRYLDKNQCMLGEYDISFLFIYFDELWDKLLSERKRYVGKVTAQEVTSFMLNTLPDFYSYLTNIARSAIVDCVDEKMFIDIAKNDIFRVNVGDYMAKTEPVFTVSKNKDASVLAELFKERLENEYTFEDYSDLDFTGRSFTYTNFRYAQFQDSRLNNVSFEGSILIGAKFYRAAMRSCCLDHCAIYEADFSYAMLENASFVNVRGRAGLPERKEWRHVGFMPVSFRYADLKNADFKWAILTGADFTGADLTGADFTGAVLDGAIFAGCIGKEV